jgi:hypothetical protein
VNISTGDNITNIGNYATVINKSEITHSYHHGDAIAQALQDVADHIAQAGNQAAREHLDLLLQQLQRQPANPGILKTLWDGIIAAMPAIASLPAAATVVTNLLQR